MKKFFFIIFISICSIITLTSNVFSATITLDYCISSKTFHHPELGTGATFQWSKKYWDGYNYHWVSKDRSNEVMEIRLNSTQKKELKDLGYSRQAAFENYSFVINTNTKTVSNEIRSTPYRVESMNHVLRKHGGGTIKAIQIDKFYISDYVDKIVIADDRRRTFKKTLTIDFNASTVQSETEAIFINELFICKSSKNSGFFKNLLGKLIGAKVF